jgi:hypothetical protein
MAGIVVVVEPEGLDGVVEVEVGGDRGPQGRTGSTGPTGPPGGRIEVVAGEDIPFLAVVRLDERREARLASSADAAHASSVVGVAETNVHKGEQLGVVQNGPMAPGTPLPRGPLFLSPTGSLTDSPNTGTFQLHVADGLATDLINVRLEPAIHH